MTRESLKSFNREFHIAEKERQQRYDFYMTLIKKICNDVEQTLLNSKTPVTQYVWKKIGIIGQWKTLINLPNIIGSIPIVVDPTSHYDRMCHRTDTILNSESVAKYLPEFIDLLKENFIDCDIIVDPLKTYLIIDWS